ncbi:uncharacterized protein F4822DRAFT_326107 [Hypoxylon trugodes]|uniref:uncharacterized protein n=1 Tax=Hypoxylon trugodes TaxID=326681 RepID=UPI00219C1CAB|nr:uncharacterized protein F4822DRAFT_326107 [Hypoxylon trugodes]KAI1386776.1 hypothetical protein F4822DRAFT_326107 [Hypoxylon trugodes]
MIMDRDSPKSPGVLAAKPNGNANTHTNGNGLGGRTSTQPFGNRRTSRKSIGKLELKENLIPDPDINTSNGTRHPLYSSPKYIPHSNSFSAATNKSPESPRESRIPQPTNNVPFATSPEQRSKPGNFRSQSVDMRQPLNIKSAFALASKQEEDQSDSTFDIKDAFKMASAELNRPVDGSPSPAPRSSHLRRQSYSAVPQRIFSGGSNGDLGSHLRQFDQNHQLGAGNRPLNGLFGGARVGPRVSETGSIFAKKASDGNLGASSARRRNSQREASSWDKGAVGALAPIPSIEYESTSDRPDDPASPLNQPAQLSPEKSLNWELDADFTAGDLQVSNSPRIRTEQSNGRPRRQSSATSSPASGTPNRRRSNNRIDQIRRKEIEAANAVLSEDDPSSIRRTNSKLDEIRVREMESLSKRAVATSRLDEIRIRNSEARSESPELDRNSNKEDLQAGSLQSDKEPTKTPTSKEGGEAKEETLDIPVTIFRNTSEQKSSEASNGKILDPKVTEDKEPELSQNDSHDLLRRLARATSSSPPSEKVDQQVPDDPPATKAPESRESSRTRPTREERRPRNLEVKNPEVKGSRERPTVGFAGLQRVKSTDSIREKRGSVPGSEADPTDRIEAEMKLFAPLDNYSEKGSVRAPSPIPSEPSELAEEVTPRPPKIDPLTQPTPRISGAYVETPATVRVKQDGRSDEKEVSDNLSLIPEISLELHDKKFSEKLDDNSIKQETNSDIKPSRRASMTRSSSVPASPRRTRSASRRRRPLRPPINTAKPPSVKDDIRAILHMNEIDDSTLDDFDSILADQEIDDEELKQMVDDTMDKIDSDLELPGLSDRDRELEIYDRMSKSLKTGLLGIRSAKKGIERLEDKVMHTEHHNDHKPDQIPSDLKNPGPKPEIRLTTDPNGSTSTTITIPALYRKSPKLRPTKFGVLLLAVSIWYIIESIFCSLYVINYHCTPQVPCQWSPNEPYFPYAMPFMIDEWTTGGRGRELTWKIGEEVGDFLAEVSDWATNTDFSKFDERYMNVWQRKRHKRRLRKHGLIPKWVPPPGYQPKFEQWNAARLAREAAIANGEEVDDETMDADEVIR